jgi:transcriptional regulator with PAS, ATPase and Fis domain
MKHNIVILTDNQNRKDINWERIGKVVSNIPALYQLVKESQVDLILFDENHDIKQSVSTRIRRYNGLTEIWKLFSGSYEPEMDGNYIDGSLSMDLGEDGIASRVKQILHTMELLQKYQIVGRSSRMRLIAETIDRIAPTEVPVLIVGPSGSGKELVARAIHNYSLRKDNPYLAINCGAIASGLLESELFGHEKGAFTGSVSKREGLFNKADSGTLFLDEIGETKPEMQVKLLRVLEDGTYYSVGSSSPRHTDVRILAATNRDLTEAIADKNFRDDLYFRIGVIKINLPPLFERKGDIQPLLLHFWKNKNLDYTDSALELLIKYDWPGNIRQLKNFADRMAAFKQKGMIDTEDVERFLDEQYSSVQNLPVSTGKTVEQAGQELIYHAILSLGNEIKMLRDLIVSHLPDESGITSSEDELDQSVSGLTVDEMEKLMIRQALNETNGNRKETAKKLGIGERTLYRKLNKYKLG